MPKTQKESLFRLIKSLSKSEKRQFKLYVNRLVSNVDTKFIALFDLMDKMTVYDELFKNRKARTVVECKKSFIQANFDQPTPIDILNLREQFDYVYILYNKGLYEQSLQMLQRVKSQAVKLDERSTEFHLLNLKKQYKRNICQKQTSIMSMRLLINPFKLPHTMK